MTQDNAMLEEGDQCLLDFTKIAKFEDGRLEVIPVAVQNVDTKEVILIAYTNEKALQRTLQTRTATFWSTSRNELWTKGLESGNTFEVCDIRVNCEQNSLVYQVRPTAGGICHTSNSDNRARNCYYRRLDMESGLLENMDP
jgi:phosphoribosyl-AMP cyclohydrolase|tara:strand:- start:166 stop:588 length:423 start_codon:yes stop_codon:yes gene_type:complete